jgi:NodT family efflux transporter outer membrane factor (OMF) lipoprotein
VRRGDSAGLAGATALAALLAACSFAPEYHEPAEPSPAAFKEVAAGDWKPAEPADAAPRGAWWTEFSNAELDALEDRVTSANQDLKGAVARYQQARAAARVARADLFPNINANAGAIREQAARNRPLYSALQPHVYSDYTLTADMSYELDLWGRVRNNVAAVKAQAQASAGDLAAMDLSLHAELATDYFLLRSYDTRQALLDDTVSAYQKALELTQRRHDGGVAAEADVDQAETQLQTAMTLAADNQLKRAQLEHAIAVLVGVPPSNFSLPPVPLVATVPSVDPGLPSQLLERRPDVAAGERRVFAANRQIGVARAAYFPTFSLTAGGGLESGSPSNLFEAPSNLWSFGPTATLALLDWGRRDALTDSARAAYDASVADYRQTVLTAYQDVEDNLIAQKRLDTQSQTQAAAVAAAQRALEQANNRYKGGIATYLEVTTAENAALQAQLSQADIEVRRISAGVLLVKALGGGWQPPQLDTPVSTLSAQPPTPVPAAPAAPAS